jgi:hypothetical protein
MPKFEFFVGTKYVGSKVSEVVEIDDDEWNDMDEESRQELLNEMFEEWVWNTVDSGWNEV